MSKKLIQQEKALVQAMKNVRARFTVNEFDLVSTLVRMAKLVGERRGMEEGKKIFDRVLSRALRKSRQLK